MKSRGFLCAAVMTVIISGGVAAGTFLFSAAYDAGVLSAGTSRTSAPRVSTAVSSSVLAKRASASVASQKPAPSANSAVNACEHDLVLVNFDNPIPSWYKPDLTDSFGVKMDQSVVEPFASMKTDASRDSVSLWISSAYRSSTLQSSLFQREVEQYTKTCPTYSEAVTAAARSVAKPGYSEHETGLAMDLNGVKDDFAATAAFRWLDSHAQDYGFVLRYPKNKESVTKIKFEPWHFRYVGVENAKAMKQSGLCLEEYVLRKAGMSR